MHIKYFTNKSQKCNQATDMFSNNICLSLSMAYCHLKREFCLRKLQFFLKGHMGTQCILQQIKSQTSGEEDGLLGTPTFNSAGVY